MAASDEQVELVRRQIEEAFADVRYPGDANLVYDTSGHHLECNQIAELFRGKHWRELTLEFLVPNRDSLCFFSPAAYRFYLPAYLLATLADPVEADLMLDSVVNRLTGPLDIPSPERDAFLEQVEGFTEKQTRAIVLFLEFLRDECHDLFTFDEPTRALHSYWLHCLQKPQAGG